MCSILVFINMNSAHPGQDNWTTIAGGNIKKVEEPLGNWDTGQRLPGDYLLRLVVTNNEGTALPPCIIPVKVVGEE